MAWDSTRPVPWRRLIRDWLLYVGVVIVIFLIIFRDRISSSAVHRPVHQRPDVHRASALCWPSSATSARRCSDCAPSGDAPAPATSRPQRRCRRAQQAGADQAHGGARPADIEAQALTSLHRTGASRRSAADSLTCGDVVRPLRDRDRRRHDRRAQPRRRSPMRRRSRRTASSRQHYPQPGWVEHDADEIWERVRDTLVEVVGDGAGAGAEVAAIGITNQRETVVAWDRRTGQPYGNGDRVAGPAHRGALRRADRRRRAADGPRAHRARARPVLLGHQVRVAARQSRHPRRRATSRSARSTRGSCGTSPAAQLHATDPSNASRTMLFDIRTLRVVAASCAICCTCRSPRCPTVHAVERPVRRHVRPMRRARRASRCRASPAISRPRCSGRRASRPAWPRTPTAPAASCC